jgi:hypothetical protein
MPRKKKTPAPETSPATAISNGHATHVQAVAEPACSPTPDSVSCRPEEPQTTLITDLIQQALKLTNQNPDGRLAIVDRTLLAAASNLCTELARQFNRRMDQDSQIDTPLLRE